LDDVNDTRTPYNLFLFGLNQSELKSNFSYWGRIYVNHVASKICLPASKIMNVLEAILQSGPIKFSFADRSTRVALDNYFCFMGYRCR